MFGADFLKAGQRIHVARLVSFVGSAFSEFAIPLYVFSHAKNPIHVGLQWSLLALTKLVSGQLAARIHFGPTDRRALMNLDLCLALSILLPVALHDTAPLLAAYLCTFLSAFLTTLQAGHIDSLVGHTASHEPKTEAARSWLLSKIENGRHVGMLIGYGLAYFVSTRIGFEGAFVVDSLTYVLSAAILMGVRFEGQAKNTVVVQPAYQILFRPRLRLLTFTQLLIGFGLFTYNAAYIIYMKRDLLASDFVVTMLFVLQYVGYSVGSLIPGYCARKLGRPLSEGWLLAIRIAVVPLFFVFAYAPTGAVFIATNAIFSVLIAAQLPTSVSLFQRAVEKGELRSMGAARTAATSFAGSIAAALASWTIVAVSGRFVFLYGAIVYAVAALTLWLYLKREGLLERRPVYAA